MHIDSAPPVQIDSSLISNAHASEFVVGNFLNECFILVEGSAKHPHFAASDTCDQALFAYKILRTKKFYAEARERLLVQLFKTVDRKIERLQKTHPGISVSMLVLLVSDKYYWLGSTMRVQAYTLRAGNLHTVKFRDDLIDEYALKRYSNRLETHALICANPQLMQSVNEEQLKKYATLQSANAAEEITAHALKRRKLADYAVLFAHFS